jgi:glycosyltransferase involved in cell wall biosynthesis
MKILIVAYHFPPSIEVGARRPSGIQKYLAGKGWKTFVLSGNPEKYEDSSMPDMNRENTQGKRKKVLKSLDSLFVLLKKIVPIRSKISSFIEKAFCIPDVHVGWAIRSVIKGREMIINNKIEFIYSTSPPYSVQLVGLALKKMFPDVIWICDFRDLWILDRGYQFIYKKFSLRRRIDAFMERKFIDNADKFVITSEGTKKEYSTRYDKQTEVVYNGYDKEYYSGENRDENRIDIFLILYCGSLYSGMRDPSTFIEVLENAIDKEYIPADKVRVDFYVHQYDKKILFRIKEKMKYPDILEIRDTIPYEKMVSIQNNVDCHLVLNRELRNEIGPIPAKIYEFIATGLPIIIWDKEDSMRADRKYLELYEGSFIATDRDKLFSDLIQIYQSRERRRIAPYAARADFSQEYMARKIETLMMDAYKNRFNS